MFDLLNLPGVRPIDLHVGHHGITIVAEVNEDDWPECFNCHTPLYRHGRRTQVFADTPIQMQPVRLEIARSRHRCNTCGKTVMRVLPFLDEKRRATKRLVDAIRQRCLRSTFNVLAEQTGLAVNTIKNIAHDLINELERTVHFETPVIMGIDEVMLAGDYRCVITNLATNNVFQILEFRTQEHLKPFFKNLPERACGVGVHRHVAAVQTILQPISAECPARHRQVPRCENGIRSLGRRAKEVSGNADPG
jgi:transposase